MGLDKITPEEGNRLVKREQSELATSSPKRLERDTVIARWLDLICQQTQTEITSEELARYWFEGLKDQPIPAIEWAFDHYMKHGCDEQGRFFRPATAQIVRLCGEWMERQAGPRSGEAIAMMDELHQRQAAGEEFFGMADLAKEFQALLREKGHL